MTTSDPQRLALLTQLARDLLHPEAYGHSVTREVRDAARTALGLYPIHPASPSPSPMHNTALPHLSPAAHPALAMRIAARAVISDIETEGVAVMVDGQRHYDVRPMLDPREHDYVCIDMAAEALSYAFDARLIASHPSAPHLVRVIHRQA